MIFIQFEEEINKELSQMYHDEAKKERKIACLFNKKDFELKSVNTYHQSITMITDSPF